MQSIVFETALGYTALSRIGEVVHMLTFGHASEKAAVKSLINNSEIQGDTEIRFIYPGEDSLADRICKFAHGEPVEFVDVPVETKHLTQFQQRVVDACRTISHGETRTYGELAVAAGRQGAALAVGSVMARNRVPLVVPCHRVVPAAGGLGGFSAPQGVAMKRRLLDMEKQACELLAR